MKKHLQTRFSTRQHMLSEDFELYYYEDAHFAGVQNHTHNYYEFYFFLQGDIAMHIGDRAFVLAPGDVILIPSGVPHHAVSLNEATPYRRFIFWISEDYFQQLLALSPDYGYIVSCAQQYKQYIYHNDTIAFNSIQARIFRLLEEIHSQRFGRNARLTLGVNGLVMHLSSMAYEQKTPGRTRVTLNLYENLLLHIDTHLEEDLSLDHLASVFFVNKYHISHVFKENLGFSVHQYITKKRLAMCHDALLNGANISHTFSLYGFKDYSSFYRAFKKEYGLSPKEYKNLHSLPDPSPHQ